MKLEFGNSVCNHAAGTHKALRGVDADGFYVTASSKCENYHSGTCRRIARCIQLYIDAPVSARLPACDLGDKVEPIAAAAPHDEPDTRPPPEPPPDFELALATGNFRISSTSSIVRGKLLPKSAICYDFLHRSFVHGEDRRLKHLPDALSDADETWVKAMAEHAFKPPCEGCLTGDAPRLGPSGSLPRDEGLIFLDIMHVSVPCIFTGFRIVVGVTHAASGKRKTVRVGSKDQARLAMEIILAYFNSLGKAIRWIHTDGANELKGSKMVPLARSKNIRITCTVKNSSRQNPMEPGWRAQMAGTRKTLHGGNLPVGFWGAAWDDTEEGQSLLPSREPPHHCSLGRLLSSEGKIVKPTGSHRRPFGSLCYPVIAERLPSGTLVNKAGHQTKRAILLGYSGGRSGDFEAIGVERSQPGYICYFPETNSTMVTHDVYICWRIQPGLERTAGGGWTIPASKIPFSSEAELEREKQRVERGDGTIDDATSAAKPAYAQDSTKEINDESEIPISDPELDAAKLDITFGYPDEPKAETNTDHDTSRGGDAPTPPEAPAEKPKVVKRFLVPRSHYPEYPCNEHGGVGWEVTVVERKGAWSRCRFTNSRDDDVPWEDVWRRSNDLIDLDSLERTAGSQLQAPPDELQPSVPDTPAELQPSVPDATSPTTSDTRPAALEPTPTDVTLPVPGGDGSLREPTRPLRDRRPTEFYGNYATPALGALRDTAALARFDTLSPRMTAATLAVDTTGGERRLGQRIAAIPGRDDIVGAISADGGTASGTPQAKASGGALDDIVAAAYLESDETIKRAALIMADHDEATLEFGPSAPETMMLRETYAAAMVDAACIGKVAPPLEPTYRPMFSFEGDDSSTVTTDELFDDANSGSIFVLPNSDCDPLIVAAAKAKTSPHIFSERQMRGPRWDTPKQLEIAKMDRLGAKIDVAADDPKIAHLKVVETMWTGRAKIKEDGSWLKDNARCVARGDLHSKHYAVTSNQTMSPVVRTPSLNAIDAVSALRRQHMTPFDVPGAYLQGKQYASEQIVCRAPAGHRTYDERGIEIYWLMQNPLYGQSDAGAIWNRTWNEFATDPDGCAYDRCPQEPCVYSKRLGDPHEDSPDDSYVTMPLYVDDGRIYSDPTEEACAEAKRDRERLTKEFGIEFKETDPRSDYFLGANRIASGDRSSCTLKATTYIQDGLAKRFFPDVDLSKTSEAFPASWSYTPADDMLVKAWEDTFVNRPKPDEKLIKKYGSLYGAVLHATKYRPEILAAMGLLGSCLTFPTEKLYYCLVRVLVYLVRTKNLGITYSAHAPNADKLFARADSNWSERRSTTGFGVFLAGAAINPLSRRQHCITMSSTEAELVALADAAIELIHVDATLWHIGHRRDAPIEVGTDNKGAHDLCHRFTSAQNSRHIDRKQFKLREMRGAGIVTVVHVRTEDNAADIFTKILPRQTFEKHRRTILNLSDPTPEVPAAAIGIIRDTEVAGSRGGSAPGTGSRAPVSLLRYAVSASAASM